MKKLAKDIQVGDEILVGYTASNLPEYMIVSEIETFIDFNYATKREEEYLRFIDFVSYRTLHCDKNDIIEITK